MIVHQRATVAALHALDPFAAGELDGPCVWWCDATDSAIVLGSGQAPATVDAGACARLGLEVVRRRSGGGAVLVRPAEVVWADIVLPHGVAPDDVRGAMVWAGERWRAALSGRDNGSALVVHRGGMVPSAWSQLVCFAGIGPGEVLLGGRKLVGLSQRRTRRGLRIQGMVHRTQPSLDVAELFAVATPPAALPPPAWLDVITPEAVVEALAAAIAA